MQNLAEHSELLLISILIAFFTLSAILIGWLCASTSKRKLVEPLEGVVGPFFALPAILFSLMSALMATSIWANYSIAAKAVRSESQSIMNIISLTKNIQSLQDSGIDRASKQYAQSIVDDEWHTLSSDQIHSPITQKKFENLRSVTFEATNKIKNTSDAEYHALLNGFQNINTARQTRLGFVFFDVQPLRWYAVLFLGLMVQIAVALVHLTKPKALVVALIIATLTILTPICMIAFTISSPYHGVMSISNAPYLEILK